MTGEKKEYSTSALRTTSRDQLYGPGTHKGEEKAREPTKYLNIKEKNHPNLPKFDENI